MGRVVLVTGVCRDLGGRFARRIAAQPDVERVIGVDVVPPRRDLGDVRFVRADIRNPVIAKVIAAEDVDTVVHLSVIATPNNAGGRTLMKEINVIGTMQLYAACQKAPALKKVVMKSTTAVYGASPRDPALFTEEMTAKATPRTGYAKDAVEVEQYARDFGRRRKDVELTIFRFANFMGSELETTLTRYFSLPMVPSPIGFDPRLQFVHEDDAVEVLYRATRESHPGIYNVAGDGVLLLSQAIRLCGKLPLKVPLPLATPVAAAIRRLGLVDFPSDQVQFLVYGRVADNTRLKERFGYTPAFTTRAALEEFAAGHRFRRFVTRQQAESWEQDLYDFLRRAGQERFERTRGET